MKSLSCGYFMVKAKLNHFSRSLFSKNHSSSKFKYFPIYGTIIITFLRNELERVWWSQSRNWVVWWKIAIFGSNSKPLRKSFSVLLCCQFQFLFNCDGEAFKNFQLSLHKKNRIKFRFQWNTRYLHRAGDGKGKYYGSFSFFRSFALNSCFLIDRRVDLLAHKRH